MTENLTLSYTKIIKILTRKKSFFFCGLNNLNNDRSKFDIKLYVTEKKKENIKSLFFIVDF